MKIANISTINIEKRNLIGKQNLLIHREKVQSLMDTRASKLHSILQDAVNNSKTFSIETLAKLSDLKQSQIISLIYNERYKDLREIFDKVKAKKETPLYTDTTLMLANNITDKASKYGTTLTDIPPSEDYITNLAKNITKSKFSDDVIAEITSAFHFAPAFIDTFMTAKDRNGHSRFVHSISSVNEIFEAYNTNPELTEKLILEKNKNGYFKYLPSIINKIVKINEVSSELLSIAKKSPILVYNLVNETDEKNNPRFGVEDIKRLYEWQKVLPDITTALINANLYRKKTQNKGLAKGTPRFTGEQICYLLDKYTQTPELVMSLVNKKGDGKIKKRFKYTAKEIIDILEKNTNDDMKINYEIKPVNLIEKQQKLEQELNKEILDNFAKAHPEAYKQLMENSFTIGISPYNRIFYIPQTAKYSAKDTSSSYKKISFTPSQLRVIMNTNPQNIENLLGGNVKIIPCGINETPEEALYEYFLGHKI